MTFNLKNKNFCDLKTRKGARNNGGWGVSGSPGLATEHPIISHSSAVILQLCSTAETALHAPL